MIRNTFAVRMSAVAVAPVPPPPVKVIVGFVAVGQTTQPRPGFTTVTPATAPAEMLAVPVVNAV